MAKRKKKDKKLEKAVKLVEDCGCKKSHYTKQDLVTYFIIGLFFGAVLSDLVFYGMSQVK